MAQEGYSILLHHAKLKLGLVNSNSQIAKEHLLRIRHSPSLFMFQFKVVKCSMQVTGIVSK